MNRDEYRKIKQLSKEDLDKWLNYRDNMTYSIMRIEFEKAYHDEVDSSIQNFITSIAYTLHFNSSLNLNSDQINDVMEDLYATVDMFRTGESKPIDYYNQLKDDGIMLDIDYDYSKIYREKEGFYQKRVDKVLTYLNNNNNVDIYTIQSILKGDQDEDKEY